MVRPKRIEHEEHYAALGLFISSCSITEAFMHSLLHQILGVESAAAKILIKEPRYKDLRELIKDACILRKTPEKLNVFYGKTFEILGYLNDIRAFVAHKPLHIYKDSLIFYNSITAKRKASEILFECTRPQMMELAKLSQRTSTYLWAHPNVEGWEALIDSVKFDPKLETLLERLQLPARPQPQPLASPKQQTPQH